MLLSRIVVRVRLAVVLVVERVEPGLGPEDPVVLQGVARVVARLQAAHVSHGARDVAFVGGLAQDLEHAPVERVVVQEPLRGRLPVRCKRGRWGVRDEEGVVWRNGDMMIARRESPWIRLHRGSSQPPACPPVLLWRYFLAATKTRRFMQERLVTSATKTRSVISFLCVECAANPASAVMAN